MAKNIINYQLLGEMLKATRERRGHTMKEVEALTAVSHSTQCRAEQYHTRLDFNVAVALAAYIGLPLEDFRLSAGKGIDGVTAAIDRDPLLNAEQKAGLRRLMVNTYEQLTGGNSA